MCMYVINTLIIHQCFQLGYKDISLKQCVFKQMIRKITKRSRSNTYKDLFICIDFFDLLPRFSFHYHFKISHFHFQIIKRKFFFLFIIVNLKYLENIEIKKDFKRKCIKYFKEKKQ